MIKALLVVINVGISGDYTTEMPSMKECLEVRTVIAKQDPDVETLCLPVANETAKIQEFFWIFMDMVDQIKSNEFEWDNLDNLNDTIRSEENKSTNNTSVFR